MSRPLEVDDLWAIPQIFDPQLSPDGRHVAYVVSVPHREKDESASRIWVVSVEDGSTRQYTNGLADSSPRWAPDGGSIAFVSKRGDDELPQLWVLPFGGGEPRRVTEFDGAVSEPAWAPDGRSLAFAGLVDETPGDDREAAKSAPQVIDRGPYKMDGLGRLGALRKHVFVVPADGGDPNQLTTGETFAASPAWSPGGDRIAFVGIEPGFDLDPVASVWTVPAGGGEQFRVTEDGRFHQAVAWAPDGSSLVTVGADLPVGGHAKLFTVPADGGSPWELAPSFDRNVMAGDVGYPGAMPAFTPGGGRLLFCGRDRGCTHLYELDAHGGEPRKVVGGEDRVVAGMTVGADRLAMVVATPATTGEIHVAGLDGSGDRRLTSHFAEALPDVELLTPEARTFAAPDGTELHGWVLRGGTGAPAPLLLDIHGGPHNAWNPAFDGEHPYQQALAARGWNVLMLNPRASDGYGEAFFSATLANWGLADEGDFLAAVDALVEEGAADPARLAVGGYSYGGYMTCWLTARTDRFAAAVAGGCVTNLATESATSDLGLVMATTEFGSFPHEKPEVFAERSPITHVANVSTPTLILHGEQDQRCSVEQAEQWFAALRARGREVQMVLYPGASHTFILDGKPSHRIDYNRRFAEWVLRHTAA
jgi:dipeptidyl aminopeptidase/acylaminoacyl peptidase